MGCGVCAASAVARAAARRAGGSAGLAVGHVCASSGHCPLRRHTPCRLGPARAGAGGAGHRKYGKHGGGGSGRAQAGSAVLCAAPGRAARGAGAPLCPPRAGGAGRPVQGRGGKVAGGSGCWSPQAQRPLSQENAGFGGYLSQQRTFQGTVRVNLKKKKKGKDIVLARPQQGVSFFTASRVLCELVFNQSFTYLGSVLHARRFANKKVHTCAHTHYILFFKEKGGCRS